MPGTVSGLRRAGKAVTGVAGRCRDAMHRVSTGIRNGAGRGGGVSKGGESRHCEGAARSNPVINSGLLPASFLAVAMTACVAVVVETRSIASLRAHL
jgi:hypothetical protein